MSHFDHSPNRLSELIQDQQLRWQRGDRVSVEWYLERHPELADRESLLDLICNEWQLRDCEQEAFSLEEYQRRFPRVAEDLSSQYEVFRGMADWSGVEFGQRSLADTIALEADTPPAGVARRTQEAAESPGCRDGGSSQSRFRTLKFHRAGGLGEVFLAYDDELHREVALKGLQRQFAGDSQRRARFVFEAEVTGRLEHPGIVPVYGLGRDAEGRPCYAMRFIRGESLQEDIDRFHGARPADLDHSRWRRWLTQRLRRFVEVCNTIAYAHSRGVLHRDLKPGNIMLGEFGETLIVDWGLAKRIPSPGCQSPTGGARSGAEPVDVGVETVTGAIVGTPGYMSPEQALDPGRLGPRSDVYSLGATLYAILCGRPPIGSSDRLVDALLSPSCPAPRKINPRIARPLEAICLKALACRPEDRYESAQALANDVENWLADEAVAARPDTWVERLGRWIRRHRSWTLAGTAALLLVAVTATVASLLVNRARQQAVNLAEQEKAARQEAVRRFRETRVTVDTWLTGASDALKYYPGVKAARTRLLEKAAEDYERFSREFSGDADIELEYGRTLLRLGDIRRELRETSRAETAYRSALARFAELGLREPDLVECRFGLANSNIRLGLLLDEIGRAAEAATAFDEAESAIQAALDDAEEVPRLRYVLAMAILSRAALHLDADRLDQATQDVVRAVDQLHRVLDSEPVLVEYQSGAAAARTLYGEILIRGGQYEAAQSQLGSASAILDRLVASDPTNPKHLASSASTKIQMAGVLGAAGRYDAKLDAFRAAAVDYETIVKAIPDSPMFDEYLAITRNDIGQLLFELGKTAEAETELVRAAAVFNRLAEAYRQIPQYREKQAACRDILGQVLSDRGRDEDAQAEARASVAILEGLVKIQPDEPQYQERLAVARSHLGQLLHKLGQHAASAEAFQQSVDDLERLRKTDAIPAYRDELAFVCGHLGFLLRDMERADDAEIQFARAKAAWDELIREFPTPEYRHHLAQFLVHAPPRPEDVAKAVTLAKQATEAAPANGSYWTVLGIAEYRAENWQAAITALRKALDLDRQHDGEAWLFLALTQSRLGDHDEATNSYRTGCQWLDDNRPGNAELKRVRQEVARVLAPSK